MEAILRFPGVLLWRHVRGGAMTTMMRLAVPAIAFLLLGCGDDESPAPQPTPPDTVPPSAVLDLSASAEAESLIVLTWTAPGDDGSDGRAARYDVRYSRSNLTETSFDSSGVVVPAPIPRSAGGAETLTVSGLSDGEWFLALKASDEAENWSSISNVASATIGDVGDSVPPEKVSDLRVEATTLRSVTLIWTAPGDDGAVGAAAQYDLRYALTPISAQSWAVATPFPLGHTPGPAGAVESFTVAELQPAKAYYFALKAADEAANWSDLSNVVAATPGLSKLTSSPISARSGAVWPQWSLDGTRIVFNADWAGNNDIYVIVVEEGLVEQITTRPLDDYAPSWSPDGLRIAFSSYSGDNRYQVWVVDATPGAVGTQLTQHANGVWQCSWSPEGSQIAYSVMTAVYPTSTSAINVISPEGGTPQTLIEDEASDNYQPCWSPGGTRIAFVSTRDGNAEIYVASASGSDLERLTYSPARDVTPCWSPDGERIAFISDRGGDADVWIMSAAGADAVQLTIDPAYDFNPTWSPDGSRIAFASRRSGKYEIWIQQLE